MTVLMDLQPQTAERLQKVLQQYQSHEFFARRVIEAEMLQLKKAIKEIQLDMRAFEQKYTLSTATFYQAFTQGDIDDEEDYLLWAGIYEMLLSNQQRLRELI